MYVKVFWSKFSMKFQLKWVSWKCVTIPRIFFTLMFSVFNRDALSSTTMDKIMIFAVFNADVSSCEPTNLSPVRPPSSWAGSLSGHHPAWDKVILIMMIMMIMMDINLPGPCPAWKVLLMIRLKTAHPSL